jgi:hypothetical protein
MFAQLLVCCVDRAIRISTNRSLFLHQPLVAAPVHPRWFRRRQVPGHDPSGLRTKPAQDLLTADRAGDLPWPAQSTSDWDLRRYFRPRDAGDAVLFGTGCRRLASVHTEVWLRLKLALVRSPFLAFDYHVSSYCYYRTNDKSPAARLVLL